MAKNKGKAFESKLKEDFMKSFPGGTIDRIYDSVSGYKTISNVSDFIGYSYPCIAYLEAKSHLGNTWPFTCFTQYDKLIAKDGKKGVIAGVVLWMIEHDVVVFLPVGEVKKMKDDGLKSFNVKMIKENNNKYNILVLPSVKKRVFMDTDYRPLLSLFKEEE